MKASQPSTQQPAQTSARHLRCAPVTGHWGHRDGNDQRPWAHGTGALTGTKETHRCRLRPVSCDEAGERSKAAGGEG